MPLDDNDKKFIGDLIKESLKPETIGDAVKRHLDGLKLGDTIKSEVEKATKGLKKAEDDDGESGEDAGEGAKKKGGKKGEPSDADKKLANIEKQLADERKAREDAENARKRDQLETAARDALVKAGVPAERVRHAMALLKTEGVLDFTADGKSGWKGKDKYQVDTVLDVEAGAAAWVKSDDGKAFLPASNAGGTGDGAGKRQSVVTSDDKIDLNKLGGKVAAAIANLPEV